jgi:glycosyltransferase involved in cell wall biosynthesis
MWNRKSVSVVLPAYNEEEGIRASVNGFFATNVVDQVIVVNNNSLDRTVEEARKTRATIVHESEQGYGAALTRGLKEAAGDYIILAEPDGTFDSNDVIKLLSYADDFDMVCGTRTTRELIWAEANMGWFLRFGNILVAKWLEALHNTCSLSDCGCTLRLIHRHSLEKFLPYLRVTGSHFLPEMVMLARKCGLRMIEIPVNYRGRRGMSKITGTLKGTWKTGMNMIRIITLYRFKKVVPFETYTPSERRRAGKSANS